MQHPFKPERIALMVDRAFAGKRDLKRFAPRSFIGTDSGDRRDVAPLIRNLEQLRILIGAPGLAIIEHVKAAVSAKLRIDRPLNHKLSLRPGSQYFVPIIRQGNSTWKRI